MYCGPGKTKRRIMPVDALICSLKEERIDGLRILQLALQRNPEICAIVVTGPEEIELGTEAMRQGAYDFQIRPLNLAKIGAVLGRGLSHQRLVGGNVSAPAPSRRAFPLQGDQPPLQRLVAYLQPDRTGSPFPRQCVDYGRDRYRQKRGGQSDSPAKQSPGASFCRYKLWRLGR